VPDEVKAVYGDKPTELEIMFPVEDPELFAQQWLRAYSLTQGLVCIGDGVTARRKVDIKTGDIANRETKQWEWREVTCNAQECPDYQAKRCRRVMNLQFLLPEVPGLGVWQIDTSSYYSIININSMVKLLKGVLGRCSMVPLTLALGPIEVSSPGQTKKTVYIMRIKQDIKLAELAQVVQLPPAKVLIPEPETEQPPEDLFPEAASEEGLEGEEDLFPNDQIPQLDEELVKGWQIVKGTVKELKLSDFQIKGWFSKHNLQVELADFDKDFPPDQITNEILSRFQATLDLYCDQQRRKRTRSTN